MSPIVRSLVFLVLALSVSAQQSVSLTPQTLTDWIIVGADAQALSKLPTLSLPEGAQIARGFESTELRLTITTQPVLGPNIQDWPVMEIGNAALVFARDGSSGKLMLVLENAVQMETPLTYALDAEGKSFEPLVVTLDRREGLVGVGMNGKYIQYPAGPLAGKSLEVVVSAGTTMSWNVAALEVLIDGSSVAINPSKQSTDPAPVTGTSIADPAKKNVIGAATPIAGTPGTLPATNDKAAQAVSRAPLRTATLEIFSPPVIRYGHAAAIRAALAGKVTNPETAP